MATVASHGVRMWGWMLLVDGPQDPGHIPLMNMFYVSWLKKILLNKIIFQKLKINRYNLSINWNIYRISFKISTRWSFQRLNLMSLKGSNLSSLFWWQQCDPEPDILFPVTFVYVPMIFSAEFIGFESIRSWGANCM